jgi:LmbE family N-acetylglucosaminyl deacetylase
MESLFLLEPLSHAIAILTFGSIAGFVQYRKRALRRTARQAPQIYRAILLISCGFILANLYCLIAESLQPVHAYESMFSLVLGWSNIIAHSMLILTLLSAKIVADRSVSPRRILAIGAHPDDLEIACGATLAKMRDAGHQIRGIVLTGGECGGDVSVRPAEAKRGAQFLGLADIAVHNFHDTRLAEQSNEILAVIEQAVREFKPDIIFTHSSHDQHQDHQATFEATLRAARNHSTILCYESPSATRAFNPTFFVDINDYVDIKIESVKEHWDQHSKPYMTAERVRGIAVFRGGQAKTRYAEGFETVRTLSSAFGDI